MLMIDCLERKYLWKKREERREKRKVKAMTIP